MSDELLAAVRDGWGWTGIDPIRITAVSRFGHLVIEDREHRFWYLDQEAHELSLVAEGLDDLARHFEQDDVREVWEARALVNAALARLGEPGSGRCYTLTPHALLSGDFSPENLITLPVAELTRFTGSLEQQTRDLPDGSPVRLKVVD